MVETAGIVGAFRRENTEKYEHTTRLKLFLFDIDGTLSTGGTFTGCLKKALEETLGAEIRQEQLDVQVKDGRNMREGVVEILSGFGLRDAECRKTAGSVIDSATAYLKLELAKSKVRPLEGVREFLDLLNDKDYSALGIATNNTLTVTRLKLASIGLLELFDSHDIIESGDTANDKCGIVKSAVSRAEKQLKARFGDGNVFYFGDQVSDIVAGKLAGVSSIGIANGKSSFEELNGAGADAVFRSFSGAKPILSFLSGNSSWKSMASKCY